MLFRGLRHLFARANPFVEDDVGFVKLTQSSLKPFTGAPKDWTRFKMMALNTFTFILTQKMKHLIVLLLRPNVKGFDARDDLKVQSKPWIRD